MLAIVARNINNSYKKYCHAVRSLASGIITNYELQITIVKIQNLKLKTYFTGFFTSLRSVQNDILSYLIILLTVFTPLNLNSEDLTKYVDPFIGTGGHGHTYPGVSLPFGMMQLSPDTRLTGWDGCSGYHYTDSVIYGFSHTHLSGTGCSDYGDILLMPTMGDYQFSNTKYSSTFNHKNEYAEPGYYSVFLNKFGIKVELTGTKRAGFHKYIYPNPDYCNILLDLKHRDFVINSAIKIINDSLIIGFRQSKQWAMNQLVYFAIRFSKPFTHFIVDEGDSIYSPTREAHGTNIKACFTFRPDENNIIFAKIGISAVDAQGALNNLDSEIPDWNFDYVRTEAKKEWNKELGKIVVEGGSDSLKKTFYTSLYHSMLNPNLFSDVDGRYRGRDFTNHKTNDFDYYTVFSLWDTYRAEHPLLTILDQKRTNDFINTFIMEYEQGHLLPVWELSSCETFCMIGYHAVPVIVDACMKGIRGYDFKKAYEACKHSAEQDQFGLVAYKKFGFIPADYDAESVSKTLEYAYDDWCIAQMAKSLGEKQDYQTFIQRAQSYKNLFDKSTGFMRAKKNGDWYSPFIPDEVNNNYTEANAWQYSFYVPQDLKTFIEMHGGNEKFAGMLDSLFTTSSKTTGRVQLDISGMIGQYAHGNEPSHHIAYLYDYCGEPWKTQEIARKIMDEFYAADTNGLCGNEDCGQMSAWYVLTAMGFYPVCPGQNEYAIGTPLFNKVTINLENGKTFTIEANEPSKNNFYIQSAKFNGKKYEKCFITQDMIMNGGKFEFKLGNKPNKSWATDKDEVPTTVINDFPIVLAPVISAESRTFRKNLIVSISAENNSKIYFSTDGSEPTEKSQTYSKPFVIDTTTGIKAFALNGNGKSAVIKAEFNKLHEGRMIKIYSKYLPQYTAGGDEGLIDGIRGNINFWLGGWQGYQGTDFEADVDLGKVMNIKKIAAGFLQNVGSWIWMPVQVEYLVSSDGKNFTSAGIIKNDISDKDLKPQIRDFTLETNQGARYLRVIAKNYGIIPEWHPGKGEKAFIFIDEIMVE